MGPTLKMPLQPQAGAQRCLRPVSRQGSSILRNGNFKYQCYDFSLTVPQENKLLTWLSTKWLWKCSSRTSRVSSHQTPSNCTQMPNSLFLFSCCCSRAWRHWAKDEKKNLYPDWGAILETYKTGNMLRGETGWVCFCLKDGVLQVLVTQWNVCREVNKVYDLPQIRVEIMQERTHKTLM